ELRQASELLPQAGAAALAQTYGTAFRHLLYVLASITTTSALLILAFLRHPAVAATDTAALPACEAQQ
ncbi:MAG: MFS transporter, partial [Janthinobacterium sp.]